MTDKPKRVMSPEGHPITVGGPMWKEWEKDADPEVPTGIEQRENVYLREYDGQEVAPIEEMREEPSGLRSQLASAPPESQPLPESGVYYSCDAVAASRVPVQPPADVCPRCEGTGIYNFGKCKICKGTGKLSEIDGCEEAAEQPGRGDTRFEEWWGPRAETFGHYLKERCKEAWLAGASPSPKPPPSKDWKHELIGGSSLEGAQPTPPDLIEKLALQHFPHIYVPQTATFYGATVMAVNVGSDLNEVHRKACKDALSEFAAAQRGMSDSRIQEKEAPQPSGVWTWMPELPKENGEYITYCHDGKAGYSMSQQFRVYEGWRHASNVKAWQCMPAPPAQPTPQVRTRER